MSPSAQETRVGGGEFRSIPGANVLVVVVVVVVVGEGGGPGAAAAAAFQCVPQKMM